jgi:hypothetical protein
MNSMILVRQTGGPGYEVIEGCARLQVELELSGSATVTDFQSGQTLKAHEVGGKLLVLDEDKQQAIERAAAALISSARSPKS